MANRTDPSATTIHGTNPQYLVEKILRTKIYNNRFWKEHCFGLTAETLVEQAVKLQAIGGTYGGARQPTDFICLVLKMLQICPEREIILELITDERNKYVRALAAFYLRLTGSAADVYAFIEPLYNDYRKLRARTPEGGYVITHMDEFAAQLLDVDASYACDIALPVLPRREQLEATGLVDGARFSALEDEIEEALAAERAAAEQAEEAAAAARAAERAAVRRAAPLPPPPPPGRAPPPPPPPPPAELAPGPPRDRGWDARRMSPSPPRGGRVREREGRHAISRSPSPDERRGRGRPALDASRRREAERDERRGWRARECSRSRSRSPGELRAHRRSRSPGSPSPSDGRRRNRSRSRSAGRRGRSPR
ncbi:hypothetical protein KFE25_010081 [Diacronema lutheri]|uniref:Pre-mRNA-splicing factor 38 n=1 Tax=Diacronema lutheri TaxID=2081491 RepID=A0A8J5XI10_DIALT|nr:hypothetical protein KFE25_010081 [Diacronema lutheri]